LRARLSLVDREEMALGALTADNRAEIRRTSARPTDNVDSYDLYLRALPVFRIFSKAETLKALELLNRAITDSDLAIEHLESAMRLDPTGPSRAARILYMAMARFYQRRFSDAVTLLKERIQLSESPGCYGGTNRGYYTST
jgi:tetratricopeptide (TPR) repeat protein